MAKTILLSLLLFFSCTQAEPLKEDLYQILIQIDEEAVDVRDAHLVEGVFSVFDYGFLNIPDSIDSIKHRVARIEDTMDISYLVMPCIIDDFDKAYASAHGQENLSYFMKICTKFLGSENSSCYEWPIQFSRSPNKIKTSCIYFDPLYLKAAVLVRFQYEYRVYLLQKQTDKWGIRYKFTLDRMNI